MRQYSVLVLGTDDSFYKLKSKLIDVLGDIHWREKYVAARLYVAHKNDVFYTQKYKNKKNFEKNIDEIDSDEVVTTWPTLIAEK